MSESSPREPGVRGASGSDVGCYVALPRFVATIGWSRPLVFACAYGADYRPTRSSR